MGRPLNQLSAPAAILVLLISSMLFVVFRATERIEASLFGTLIVVALILLLLILLLLLDIDDYDLTGWGTFIINALLLVLLSVMKPDVIF